MPRQKWKSAALKKASDRAAVKDLQLASGNQD